MFDLLGAFNQLPRILIINNELSIPIILFQSLDDPLPRVEEGNYEYRVVLRCRAQARAYFLQLRSDVRVKLQLLNSKHGDKFCI